MNATIALAVHLPREGGPRLIDVFSDNREILLLESAVLVGEVDPLQIVYEHRDKQAREDEEFSNYVENLLSKPFLKSEIQEHGVQWLKSKIRIEKYQRDEREAARIIADYAFEVFRAEMEKTDFLLAGPRAEVRIRIFILEGGQLSGVTAA